MIHGLLLTAVALAAVSGLPGLFMPRRSMAGQYLSVPLFCAGSLAGLGAALLTFLDGTEAWSLPFSICGGKISLLIDPLSAVFLVSIFLISALGSVFGLEYWRQTHHPENGRKLRLFYGLLTAGLSLVVVAHDTLFFLFSWEIMALSAFFLVGTEDDKKEPARAGWIYFVATHFSTLSLFAFFGLLHGLKGSFELTPFAAGEISAPAANGLFLLAFFGFGLKAGLFPLHVWLPSAHANAPTHVSSFLSGVLLKVGVYGLLRACWLFPQPPAWWGTLLVTMGILSSVLGVAFALGQHDLKRLLAYHSVENIGIIFLGMGLALWGRSEGRPELVLLGLAGALLHVWNHGLFKSLLFLAAGSVIHSLHTREIDAMGGLEKRMPKTALFFLVGAAAICGLPPLNGFISEFLIYAGFFKALNVVSLADNGALWMAVPALALTGGLAVACFTKVYGVVFLGEPRTDAAAEAKEGGAALWFPMALLAALCFVIGLLPQTVAPCLEAASRAWGSLGIASPSLLVLIPWGLLSLIGFSMFSVFLLGLAILTGRFKSKKSLIPVVTWDCGYLKPSASMQYTASSYAQMLVDLFKWALFPSKSRVELKGSFPKPSSFHNHVPETVLDLFLLPVVRGVQWLFQWFKYLQVGYLQAYVSYILLAFLFFILWR